MTIEETLKLINAGYTKSEIEAMGKKEAPEEKKEAPEEKKEAPEEKKEAPEEKKEAPEQNETIKQLIEQNNKLLQKITDLQSDNIKNAKQTENEDKPKSADDVIKSFFKTL